MFKNFSALSELLGLVVLIVIVFFLSIGIPYWLGRSILWLTNKLSVLYFLLVFLLLMLIFLRFTIVKEGTAKVVIRLGSFHKALLTWKDHCFDENWNVVGEKKWDLPGGLRFVGFWPLDKIYRYKFRWRDIQLVGGEERVEFHEQEIDYIFVRPDIYWTDIKGAETRAPERIPLDIQFLVTIRIVNPYKALFRTPSNWNENVMGQLNTLFRDWVATKTIDDILALQTPGLAQILWAKFGKHPLITQLRDEWGIQVEKDGVKIRAIGMAPEYQRAAAEQKRQEFEAAARAAQAVGTVIAMMAQSRGKGTEEIKKEIDASPELRKEFLDLAKDLIKIQLAIEGKSYLDLSVRGAEGIERIILNALAAWKRMP